MRGFLIIVINSPDDVRLLIQDGGEPFSFVELLGYIQKAQGVVLQLMAKAAQVEEAKEGGNDG